MVDERRLSRAARLEQRRVREKAIDGLHILDLSGAAEDNPGGVEQRTFAARGERRPNDDCNDPKTRSPAVHWLVSLLLHTRLHGILDCLGMARPSRLFRNRLFDFFFRNNRVRRGRDRSRRSDGSCREDPAGMVDGPRARNVGCAWRAIRRR